MSKKKIVNFRKFRKRCRGHNVEDMHPAKRTAATPASGWNMGLCRGFSWQPVVRQSTHVAGSCFQRQEVLALRRFSSGIPGINRNMQEMVYFQ
jgi:hypothetical protein